MQALRRCFFHYPWRKPRLLECAGTYFSFVDIPNWFIGLRAMLFMGLLAQSVFSIYVEYKQQELRWYFHRLGNWSQLLCLVVGFIRFTSSSIFKRLPLPSHPRMHGKYVQFICKIQPKLQRTALPCVTLAVIDYWIFEMEAFSNCNKLEKVNMIQLYGIGCLLMWLDYLISFERIWGVSSVLPFFALTIYTVVNAMIVYFESITTVSSPNFARYCVRVVMVVFISLVAASFKNMILKAVEDSMEETPRMIQIAQTTDNESEESEQVLI